VSPACWFDNELEALQISEAGSCIVDDNFGAVCPHLQNVSRSDAGRKPETDLSSSTIRDLIGTTSNLHRSAMHRLRCPYQEWPLASCSDIFNS